MCISSGQRVRYKTKEKRSYASHKSQKCSTKIRGQDLQVYNTCITDAVTDYTIKNVSFAQENTNETFQAFKYLSLTAPTIASWANQNKTPKKDAKKTC